MMDTNYGTNMSVTERLFFYHAFYFECTLGCTEHEHPSSHHSMLIRETVYTAFTSTVINMLKLKFPMYMVKIIWHVNL